MPKSIKPIMSMDELRAFDRQINYVTFDDGEAVVTVDDFLDKPLHISFSERDLEDLIQFIRRNKL